MTSTKTKRILQAIAECERFIQLEGKRSDDLRPAEVAKTLAFYKQHKLNLIAMLA